MDILSLPSNEFEQLKKWLFDLDYERWDEQLEQDIAEGKLEALAQEAIAEFEAGHFIHRQESRRKTDIIPEGRG
ncbi:hypothetical protein ACE1CI_31940 [Aerosakkonemataceae cyanobacterium BLCC-F50]|uniref:Uncharacterized protein n=1 Tax=Floridaenema flaviceps BLCC-F50 TaxID=3153642 RepID=A0ABV4Y0N1_9CYAN